MNTQKKTIATNNVLQGLLVKEAKPPAQKLELPTLKPNPISGLVQLNLLPEQGGYFEIFKDIAGQYRFRLRAPNNEPILASEGYITKQKCLQGINAIKRYALYAKTKDFTK